MCIRSDTTLQRDGRTDGQTEMVKQYRAVHTVHIGARHLADIMNVTTNINLFVSFFCARKHFLETWGDTFSAIADLVSLRIFWAILL